MKVKWYFVCTGRRCDEAEKRLFCRLWWKLPMPLKPTTNTTGTFQSSDAVSRLWFNPDDLSSWGENKMIMQSQTSVLSYDDFKFDVLELGVLKFDVLTALDMNFVFGVSKWRTHLSALYAFNFCYCKIAIFHTVRTTIVWFVYLCFLRRTICINTSDDRIEESMWSKLSFAGAGGTHFSSSSPQAGWNRMKPILSFRHIVFSYKVLCYLKQWTFRAAKR